jgi:serine/threonine protein kinase
MSQESALKVFHELTAAGLLSSDAVTRFSDEIESGAVALLDKLLAENVITQYQADKFLSGQASDICFGDYLVLNELGRGGMGTVLLAKHRRMDREVAIKVLPVTAMESESAVARFYQEVKVAAQLKHPNIVHAYDAGEHHGFHYLVMEYVQGHDLAHVVHEIGPLPLVMAIDYMKQACQGLQWAHNKKVIHRDIKPSNLLLDDEGNIKILDMGLARLGGNGSLDGKSMHLTTTGQVMGTVEFMSPEQAEDTRLADERSDIYSLGCTFYRLLSTAGPYSRDTVVKTILAHRNEPVPELPGRGDPLHPGAQRIFERMVAKDPAKRYQSVEELIEDFEQVDDLGGGSYSEHKFDLSMDREPVTRLSADQVVELPEPPTVVTQTVEPKSSIPRTAVAIRIEDDGSMTNIVKPQNEGSVAESVIDLSDNHAAHISPPVSGASPVQGDVFRIEDDASFVTPEILFLSAAFVLLLIGSTGSMVPGIAAIVGGGTVFVFAKKYAKRLHQQKGNIKSSLMLQTAKVVSIVAILVAIVSWIRN